MAGRPLDLAGLAALEPQQPPGADSPPRQAGAPSLSLGEVAAFVLPMAAEHLRRVLRQHPDLPQGRPPASGPADAGSTGEQRRFTPADMARLRAHFIATGAPGRWQPVRPAGGHAQVVVMAGPAGGLGKTVALCHLAVAAALSGRRVLVIAGDPWGSLDQALGAAESLPDAGLLGLLARAEAGRLARLNAARLDRGEPALAVDEALAAARAAGPLRPATTAWPGLDLVRTDGTGGRQAALADLMLGQWARVLPESGGPGGLDLGAALAAEGARAGYDLILCDTPPGLGPLARCLLAAADLLLAPLPPGAGGRMLAGLAALGRAATLEAEAAAGRARALGLALPQPRRPDLAILPVRLPPGPAGATALAAAQGQAAVGMLAGRALPAGLPEVPAVAQGIAPHLFAWGERAAGRAAWPPLRQAAWAGWEALAARLDSRTPEV